MKFDDIFKLFNPSIKINLYVYANNIENDKSVGAHTASEIINGCWSEYRDYYVADIRPIDKENVRILVMESGTWTVKGARKKKQRSA